MPAVSLETLVPGGIKPTDRWHMETNNNTCSRCRAEVPDEDCPLLLWDESGNNMLIYCERCLAWSDDEKDGSQ